MKILRRFWERLAEERYTAHVINGFATLLTLYTVLFTSISPPFAWMMGFLNGAMWLIDLLNDDDD